MKIAFVTQPGHKVLPAAGSLELWTEEIARRLAGRHEVTVYASGQADETVEADGVVYALLSHSRGALAFRGVRFLFRALPRDRAYFSSAMHPFVYWARVGRALRRSQPDIVHVFNYSQAVPILRRFSPSTRFVLHMQCEWLSQLNRSMIARRLRHTDLILACSDHIRSLVVDRFPEHADRCRTIYNGVDVRSLAGRERDQPKPLTLLNVGRVSPEKGLHVLVDAFNDLVRDYPELELVSVGDDAVVPFQMAVALYDDPLIQALARFYEADYGELLRERLSEQAARRVTFVGRVEHDETEAFYRDADIFVYPSLFESFAIPPVEAMAAGIPVVASRVGGMTETIVHEETGLLVEREDATALAAALRRLIEDPGLRESFGESGRERAAHFSWPRIAGDVEDAFVGLVEAARESSPAEFGFVGIG